MRIEVLSLFPSYIEGPLQESILKKAIQKNLLTVSSVDIRDFSSRKDRRVDDRPYGGGPGMVMMAEPVVAAIRARKQSHSHVVYLSPQGEPLTARLAKQFSTYQHLILIAGHYEGIDQRVLDHVDQEVSIGDYVLTNGCLAALVLIDTVARFIPGILGHPEASQHDSFESTLFDHPHYTKPTQFEGKEVPEVLLSGHHEKINQWRKQQAYTKTRACRPDLLTKPHCTTLKANEGEIPQMTLASYRFEQAVAFYSQLLGKPSEQENDRVVFACNNISLAIVPTYEPIASHDILSLSLPSTSYTTVCALYVFQTKKEPTSNKYLKLYDPDHRMLEIAINQNNF